MSLGRLRYTTKFKSLSRDIHVSKATVLCSARPSIAFPIFRPNNVSFYSTEPPNLSDASHEIRLKDDKLGGFAKSLKRFSSPETEQKEEEQTFLRLLKNSKFIDLGDPEGKIVTGTIFHVVDNDLYVDFGWKFHCVVSRPPKNPQEYVRGARVRLSLKNLELSTRFLGSDKDLTLLEADAVLVGLVSSPARSTLSASS